MYVYIYIYIYIYERRIYASINDRSLSRGISQKLKEKKTQAYIKVQNTDSWDFNLWIVNYMFAKAAQ